MLVLSRKVNESIQIGDDIKIVIVRITHNKIRIGIEAPKSVPVVRGELPPITTLIHKAQGKTAQEIYNRPSLPSNESTSNE